MWSGEVAKLDPELQPYVAALLDVAQNAGYQPRVSSTLRTLTTQRKLYWLYRAGRSLYPASAPGRSAHNYGFAVDIVTTPMEALQELGPVWESWGGTWGGRFGSNDPIHFEVQGASDWLRQASDDDIEQAMRDYGLLTGAGNIASGQ